MTDYRTTAYAWAGPGNEARVDAIAKHLHYNESIHLHELGDDRVQDGACSYCWLRAAKAVQALAKAGLLAAGEPEAAVAP